jgi:hypothetical protein
MARQRRGAVRWGRASGASAAIVSIPPGSQWIGGGCTTAAKYAAKVLAAALTAVAAIALVGQETDQWHLSPRERFWAAIVGVLIGFIGSISSIGGQRASAREERRRDKLRALLQPVALRLQDLTRIDVRDLGLAAYALRRGGWWLWPWQPRLRRMYRVRPKIAAVSHVDWRPGKGVMGACVAQGQDVAEDIAALEDLLKDETRASWDSSRAYGLNYDEFLDTRGKYGVILATPILGNDAGGSSVVGVLVLDGPAGAFGKIVTDEVRAELASVADQIAANVISS